MAFHQCDAVKYVYLHIFGFSFDPSSEASVWSADCQVSVCQDAGTFRLMTFFTSGLTACLWRQAAIYHWLSGTGQPQLVAH